jgi:NAD(P)-dependent dehydrogenase (short-subunit alcohol dehydrogenase family)
MGKLDGRVAVVTGGARGLGREYCLAMAREGANIAILDVCENLKTTSYSMSTVEQMNATVQDIESLGVRGLGIKCDVRKGSDLEAAYAQILKELKQVDVVLANAGICTMGPTWELEEEVWDETLDVNLKGVWLTTKYIIPHMMERKSGSIILVSSVCGFKGYENLVHYDAAKFGVRGIMMTLCKELAPHNIRVNCIAPSTCWTDLVHNTQTLAAFGLEWDPEREEEIHQKYNEIWNNFHLLQVGSFDPKLAAPTVVFLASDDSQCLTGHTLPIDAGALAR